MNAVIKPQTTRKRPQSEPVATRLAVMETRWEEVIPTLATNAALNEAVAQLRTDMHKMEATITRWMLGVLIGMFVGFAGMFFAQQRSLDNAIDRLDRKIDRIERLYAPMHNAVPTSPPDAGTASSG